jgi:hypothetical protein
MNLNEFFSEHNDRIRISRNQASDFAKAVAGDFNPIHDADSRRFCVPGDLLFGLALARHGLSEHMNLVFSGMVGDGVGLVFREVGSDLVDVTDDSGRKYLSIRRSGVITRDPDLIGRLTRRYVEFSGQTFPHILVPLMSEQGVMINPDRPLVIYESMAIDLQTLDISDLQLSLTSASFDVNGKRGSVRLRFSFESSQRTVGEGEKAMVLSGLRRFDVERINELVDAFNARKQRYQR